VILLDTHALIWLDAGSTRARKLARSSAPLAISPASLLELQFLVEQGRIRFRRSARIDDLADDERWTLDEPPAAAWFEAARSFSWTRDPFDRIVVAHAAVRGWKLATADTNILKHLEARHVFEL
jgi:PIN domain nuclease of toxin-antitoxin system